KDNVAGIMFVREEIAARASTRRVGRPTERGIRVSRDEFNRLFDPDPTGNPPTSPDPEDNGLYHYPDFEDDVSRKPYRNPRSGWDFDRVVLWVVAVLALLWSLFMVVVVVAQRAEGAPVGASPESGQIVAPSCKVASPRGDGSGVLLTLPGKDGLYVLSASHVVED